MMTSHYNDNNNNKKNNNSNNNDNNKKKKKKKKLSSLQLRINLHVQITWEQEWHVQGRISGEGAGGVHPPPPPPAPKKNPGSAPDVASWSACDGTKRMQEETRERHLGDPLGSGRKVWVWAEW